ncbi:Methyltransferase domain-containing protein [Rhizobiales bacterium GAS113]|nr:Methyltransferase domain-containing protein [Rhizobiales bacterium GAS113]
MTDPTILRDVAAYYGDNLRRFGSTPAGVDWRNAASQATRFDQLLRLVTDKDASVVDFGCGYGALLGHMRARGFSGLYRGIDIVPEMVAAAKAANDGDKLAAFEIGATASDPADFAVASGIFNVRLRHSDAAWHDYVETVIAALDKAGLRGFAFNCLTSYSDTDRMRADLFYADPCFYFDLCKRRYARQVALLHDYGLYEFTMIVRKGS